MGGAAVDLSLRDLLRALRPQWTAKSLSAVLRKLAQINIETQLDLLLEFRDHGPDGLNTKLRSIGEKCFTEETLNVLKDGVETLVRPPPRWRQSRPARVACVGDSITKLGYPRFLMQALEGVACPGNRTGWEVLNFGVSGTCATNFEYKERFNSYHRTRTYIDALEAGADFVLICFGTNDARTEAWNEDRFIRGYCSIVGSVLASMSAAANPEDSEPPLVLLLTPPPLYRQGANLGSQQSVLNVDLPYRILPRIAVELGTGLVDVFSALGGPDLSGFKFMEWDCCHPSDKGHELIAAAVRDALEVCVASGRLPRRVPSEPSPNLPSF